MKIEDLLVLVLAGIVMVFLAYGCGLVIDGGLSPDTIEQAIP